MRVPRSSNQVKMGRPKNYDRMVRPQKKKRMAWCAQQQKKRIAWCWATKKNVGLHDFSEGAFLDNMAFPR